MKRFLFCWMLLSVTATRLLGQTPAEKQFNQAFLHIYMNMASENVHLALEAADSLYQTATNDVEKIRSMMLISDMFHRMAQRDSSIHYAVEAERIAQRTDDYVWQARICGVLSTQYREMRLFHEGKRYLEKGLEVIEKVKNPEMVNQFKGQCYQDLSFYAIEEKQYRDAIGCLKKAEPFFAALRSSIVKDVAMAQNEERLGLCYLKLDRIDSAKQHYETALTLDRRASEAETPLTGFIYNGLGRIQLELGNQTQADSCLQVALAIAEMNGFPHLKISVYESLAKAAKRSGNDQEYRHYNEKYLSEVRENTASHRKYADNTLTRVRQKAAGENASNRTLRIGAIALAAFAGLAMVLYVRRQRKNEQRYKDVISRLRSERIQALAGEHATVPAEQAAVAAGPLPGREKDHMPENTKQELLKKLEQFEVSRQFTERNISIAMLAGQMKTNTKYLSYIINNYRKTDFNGYINELRINYIVKKMEADSRYLNCKIGYLAEAGGFATNGQFTKAFINITGLSPSTFMMYLKNDVQVRNTELAD